MTGDTLRLVRPGGAIADCNANFFMLVPVFSIGAVQTGANVVISFPTQSGFNYQLQYKNDLVDAVWNSLGDYAGDDTVKFVSDPETNVVRFYRMQIQ